jgi:guanylate kinase
VLVITGPSGVGKGTLIAALMRRLPNLELSVSATTREPRPGERDGRDYHFLTPEEFERRVEAGEFLEHATYSGHRYGTLRGEVERRLAAGRSVVLEIEVQGARQIRAAMPEAVLIFIAPPGPDRVEGRLEALRERLRGRGTDSEEEMARRLETARIELEAQVEFPHVVVNEDVQDAAERLERLVRAELSLH